MKLNLDKPVVDLNGETLQPPTTIGKMLANLLMSVSEGDPLKYFGWAVLLNRGEPIELDPADFEHLRAFLLNNRNIINLVKATIINEMILARDQNHI